MRPTRTSLQVCSFFNSSCERSWGQSYYRQSRSGGSDLNRQVRWPEKIRTFAHPKLTACLPTSCSNVVTASFARL